MGNAFGLSGIKRSVEVTRLLRPWDAIDRHNIRPYTLNEIKYHDTRTYAENQLKRIILLDDYFSE